MTDVDSSVAFESLYFAALHKYTLAYLYSGFEGDRSYLNHLNTFRNASELMRDLFEAGMYCLLTYQMALLAIGFVKYALLYDLFRSILFYIILSHYISYYILNYYIMLYYINVTIILHSIIM